MDLHSDAVWSNPEGPTIDKMDMKLFYGRRFVLISHIRYPDILKQGFEEAVEKAGLTVEKGDISDV
ncbi:MAG: hypothetical protein ACLUGF_05645 [Clostridium sp.]